MENKKEDFEQTKNLLQEIGKNVAMAVQSLEIIIPKVQDEKFKEYLSNLNQSYSLIMKETKMMADSIDLDLKLTSPLEKAQLWTSINIKSIADKSTRNFAEMIFLGTNMGIPDLIEAICDNKNASSQAIVLAKKLKEIEETSDETIKLYLCR